MTDSSRMEAGLLSSVWRTGMQPLIRQIAISEVPVLIQGETGCGKEIMARHLHSMSVRSKKRFLKVNCAALPSELIESELFGYERGAFTGAFKTTPGKFEMAEGGIILLDEIGDMDFKLQSKLLQVLQDSEFIRLGSSDPRRVDVRVMAATHCNLEHAIEQGRFREDLYYRLNIITIQVPPLRERKDEILPLAYHFMRKHATAATPHIEFSPMLRDALLTHDWPGNVRELENVIRKVLVLRRPDLIANEIRTKTRRAIPVTSALAPIATSASTPIVMKNDSIRFQQPIPEPVEERAMAAVASGGKTNGLHIPGSFYERAHSNIHQDFVRKESLSHEDGADSSRAALSDGAGQSSILARVDQVRRQAETDAIMAALSSTLWNRKRAAELLNVDYKALLYKMKKLGIAERAAKLGV